MRIVYNKEGGGFHGFSSPRRVNVSKAMSMFLLLTVPGCEERSPEPKPRWNPKPEQIRILEAIFNSGMVNPPRDEIRKIRAQLQEFGQVGDANVFYWFQNRKSRSKHKQRHLQTSKQQPQQTPPITSNASITPSSSSSSSEKSSPKESNKSLPLGSAGFMDVSNSPTAPLNQTYFQNSGEFLQEPLFFPVPQTGGSTVFSHGLCFSELSNVVQIPDQTVGAYSGLLLTELMNQGVSKKYDEEEKMKLQQQLSYTVATLPPTTSVPPPTTLTLPSTINQIQGTSILLISMPTPRPPPYSITPASHP